MITITRCQARRLRATFRRHALGIAHKGHPATAWPCTPTRGAACGSASTTPRWPSSSPCPGTLQHGDPVALPLEAPGDVQGRDEGAVTLEAAGPGRTLLSWADRGIPRSRSYAVTPMENLATFPELPDRFEPVPATLLDALVEAGGTTDADSTRYALGCLALRGDSSDLAATDGRQLLLQGGFAWPWVGTVLVRRPPPLVGQGVAAGPPGGGWQDGRPRRPAGRGLDGLARHPGRRPLPPRRPCHPRGGVGGHPAAAGPGGRRLPGRGAGSPARRRADQRA